TGAIVYVADTKNHRVQAFTAGGQFIRKWGKVGGPDFSGSGPGEFNTPEGIAVDAGGNVYVADTGNARIQKFTSTGMYLLQWGRPGSGESLFLKPSGVAVGPNGSVYVCDRDITNSYIEQFDSMGKYVRSWSDARPIYVAPLDDPAGLLRYPCSIAVGSDGRVYVTETGADCVTRYSATGSFETRWGESGWEFSSKRGVAQLRDPMGVAVSSVGGATRVFVCDTDNDRIRVFGASGEPYGVNGSWGVAPGYFNAPVGVAVGPTGSVIVGDSLNHRIQRFRADGEFEATTQYTTPPFPDTRNLKFDTPLGVAVDGADAGYVADSCNDRIHKIAFSGRGGVDVHKWGARGTGGGFFSHPRGGAGGRGG
ncbi:MAG: hypothetical protein FDZ75_08025, partial [Actinobacteria bacterium]